MAAAPCGDAVLWSAPKAPGRSQKAIFGDCFLNKTDFDELLLLFDIIVVDVDDDDGDGDGENSII